MKTSKKASRKPLHIFDLVRDGKVNKAVQFDLRNSTVKSCINECAAKYKHYVDIKKEIKNVKYQFLEDAYVVALNAHQRVDELETYAKSKDISFNKRTDIFGFVIKLAMLASNANRRLASEYAGALRYLYSRDTPGNLVAEEIKKQGGISGCRKKLSALRRALRTDKKSSPNMSTTKNWNKVKEDGYLAKFSLKNGKMKGGRYALLAGCNKKGGLTIYKSISIKDSDGERFLKSIAK